MRRLFMIGAWAYLGLAAVGHARERSGALTCECRGDCWCKRRGVRLFRWVFPFKHRFD